MTTDALARLDRLPKWPWSRRTIVLIGGSTFFAFYDIIVIGAVLPVVAGEFGVDVTTAAIAITASLVGVVIGSIFDGFIADRFGRTIALQLAMQAGCFRQVLAVGDSVPDRVGGVLLR